MTSWAVIFQSALLPWLPARRLRLNPNALVLACVQTLCRSRDDEVSAEITQTPDATKLGAKPPLPAYKFQNKITRSVADVPATNMTSLHASIPAPSTNSTSCGAQAAQNP
ncbi:unnamed protein product [Sphagnum jensenii]|uniref:Secreted protein n=1 Tax=Sphagnum jensenii TaxID=128206 RepID=A0ABP0WE58_9BRYO